MLEATNVIKILDEIIKREFINSADKPLFSLDIESNSIIIMGIDDEISNIDNLIRELDKEKLKYMFKLES